MSVFEVVREIIVEILDIPAEEIKMESTFEKDLDADSLDIVEMLMLLEEKYDIEIPEETAEGMKTVKDAVDYVEQRLKEKE